MHDVETLSQRVRTHGGKVTSQRLLIWRAIEHDQSHPTAEDLYARLRPVLPGLSLTTLYNTLTELVEWGEIRRFDTGDGHIHYDPDVSAHAELVCLGCHRVIDVPNTGAERPLPHELAGYRIVSRSEQYHGYCPDCQRLHDHTHI